MKKPETNYYQSLYEVAEAANSAHTPESVLRSIVERVSQAMEAKGCSLMLLTPDRKLLLHTIAYGLSDSYVRKGAVSTDKSLSAALEGTPVAVLDATKDEWVQYREQAKKEGIASILSVPMMLREEIIGVIRVYTAEQRNFTTDEVYFVKAVANLGAIALENARLYDAVQKDYEASRREMLEWRAALGYEWIAQESVVPPEEYISKEKITVSGDNLVALVKRLMGESNVRRMYLIHERRCLMELPALLGSPEETTGLMVAPVLSALAAFGAVTTECTIEVEKTEK